MSETGHQAVRRSVLAGILFLAGLAAHAANHETNPTVAYPDPAQTAALFGPSPTTKCVVVGLVELDPIRAQAVADGSGIVTTDPANNTMCVTIYSAK